MCLYIHLGLVTVIRQSGGFYGRREGAIQRRAGLWGPSDIGDADLPTNDAARIEHLLRNTLAIHGEDRHTARLNAIRSGEFSFGAEEQAYVDQEEGSLKMLALGADPDDETGDEVFDLQPGFYTSGWKLFHDAVQCQRLFVLHYLLPRFKLMAS